MGMILLTNDDGIDAEGLYAIAETLRAYGDVLIVAPATQQSGVGHALTLRDPLRVTEVSEWPVGVRRLRVEGSPADAVKFALVEFLDEVPMLVVSGPNTGPNTGVNILYSGTVAATKEAVRCGVSAIAISSDMQDGVWDWTACCHYTGLVVEKALAEERVRRAAGRGNPFLWNVNVPARPLEEIQGVRITRMGKSGFTEFYTPHPDWADHYLIAGHFSDEDGSLDFDASAMLAGYVSLTPLHLDFTDDAALRRLQESGLFS